MGGGLSNENITKMKIKTIILIIFLSSTMYVYGQGKYGLDSTKCISNISLYREYYKQKNYDEALAPWRWVFINCPKSTGNIYKNGPYIIKHLIKKKPNLKKSYTDTLMLIYDQRIKYFGKEGYVLGRKGSDLLIYDKDRYNEAYNYLKQSVNIQKEKSEASVLHYFFKSISIMEKNNLLSVSDVINAYSLVTDYIDYNLINNTSKSKYYNKSLEKIEKTFTTYANCEDLINIYSNKFSNTTNDLKLLKRIIKVLSDKKCNDSQIYFDASNRLYELDPSPSSASEMGKMCISRKKIQEGIKYLKMAVDNENDNNLKAKYLLELADAYRISESFNSARNAVMESLKNKPGWGESYLLLANIYISGAKKCKDFDSKAVYWIIVDTFKKALVDTETKDRAAKKISLYSKYFPTKEECFFNGFSEGQNYSIECWINKNTTVRTSD